MGLRRVGRTCMRVCGVVRFGVTHMKCMNEWCELTDLDHRLFTRVPPPPSAMPRRPSYWTAWPSPRLFYHAVTEEGRGGGVTNQKEGDEVRGGRGGGGRIAHDDTHARPIF